jgi:hypothetical protein
VAKGEINFSARAILRKYPSLNSQRNSEAAYPAPYLLLDGTLDECIEAFMSMWSVASPYFSIFRAFPLRLKQTNTGK